MKIWFELDSLSRLGEQLHEVWHVLEKYPILAPAVAYLPQNDDEGDGKDLVLAASSMWAMGGQPHVCFDIRTAGGAIALSWHYHARAWFQRATGELDVGIHDLGQVVEAVGELSQLLLSAYSVIELSNVRGRDIKEFSGAGIPDDPWDCLDDLYWYNYFGPELTKTLRDVHGIQLDSGGVSQRQLGRGWEVRVDGLPRPRPYPSSLVKYLSDTGVFRRHNPRAKFKQGHVEFDYSQVRHP